MYSSTASTDFISPPYVQLGLLTASPRYKLREESLGEVIVHEDKKMPSTSKSAGRVYRIDFLIGFTRFVRKKQIGWINVDYKVIRPSVNLQIRLLPKYYFLFLTMSIQDRRDSNLFEPIKVE